MQVKDLKQDDRNYRKHNNKNKELIKKSVKDCGFGRSIVIDNENKIICGNGITSTLDNDTKLKIIESDGSELIVVKRTDLATNDEKRKQLAIMDNSTSDSSEFDFELLQEDFDNEILLDFGLHIDNIDLDSTKNLQEENLDFKEKFAIYIECKNELEQEEIYYRLTEMGIKCQVKTL